MPATTAMIPPIPVDVKDGGMLVGGTFDGGDEDGKVVVVITDGKTVTGVGVMREEEFSQSRARNVTLVDDTPSSSQLTVTSLMAVQ
jgi:hypothetical protein